MTFTITVVPLISPILAPVELVSPVEATNAGVIRTYEARIAGLEQRKSAVAETLDIWRRPYAASRNCPSSRSTSRESFQNSGIPGD